MNGVNKLTISVSFEKGTFDLKFKDINYLDLIDTNTYPADIIRNMDRYNMFIKECTSMASTMAKALKTDSKLNPKFEEIDCCMHSIETDSTYRTLRLNVEPFTVFYVEVLNNEYFKLYKSIGSLIRNNHIKTANNFQDIYNYLVNLYEEQH